MNYEQFLVYKEELIAKNPSLLNLAENNLYRYFPSQLKYAGQGHIDGVVYRCHLVENWLSHYHLPEEFKKYIGVSDGVRHSLTVLMNYFKKKSFIIPSDVYPFYQHTLQKLNIHYQEYQTLDGKELFSSLSQNDSDILLITDPLKPLGREITPAEYQHIHTWLLKNPSRLLIVDSVYMLSDRLNPYLLELYQKTNQVILLHSLSKAWSLPSHFGVTILPQNSIGKTIREEFKQLVKNQDKLNLAYVALNHQPDIPQQLKELFHLKKIEIEHQLHLKLPSSEHNPSYLFYVEKEFEDFLKENVLVMPASIFGSDRGSVISLLT